MDEVNSAVHSEIHAVLAAEREVLTALPSLRLEIGPPAGDPQGR
jgi:hypothetical protein